MPSDSDPIKVTSEPDDIFSILGHALEGIQFKFLILFFLAFLGISSDIFINRVLTNFPNAVDTKYPTNYGTVIQGVILVLVCIVLNVLISQKII
jgi:hypothetical protein